MILLNNIFDRLTDIEAKLDLLLEQKKPKARRRNKPSITPIITLDYESVELDFEPDEPSEFAIFYKGGQISMNEIVLRLNRLSELEKQNDAISALVLNWTEKVIELSENVDKNEPWDNGYCQGKLEGVEMCRDGISDIWKEGWKK